MGYEPEYVRWRSENRKIDVREGYRTELFTFLRGSQCGGSCQVAWSQLGDHRCQAALNNFNALNDDEKSLCPNARKALCRYTDYNCVVYVPMPKEDGTTATTFTHVPLKKCAERVRGFAQQCREFRDFIGAKN
nr:PREDICTED: uncharacterized protein LOC109043787 [Bemisia tabaci]